MLKIFGYLIASLSCLGMIGALWLIATDLINHLKVKLSHKDQITPVIPYTEDSGNPYRDSFSPPVTRDWLTVRNYKDGEEIGFPFSFPHEKLDNYRESFKNGSDMVVYTWEDGILHSIGWKQLYSSNSWYWLHFVDVKVRWEPDPGTNKSPIFETTKCLVENKK